MKKIGYFPPPSEKNSYTIRMSDLLGQFGDVTPISPKKWKNAFFGIKKYDVIVFNWLENRCFGKNGKFKFSSFIISMLWFSIMKHSARKIIYVRHNIYPHNILDKNKKLSVKIMNYFERKSSYTVVHSKSACTGGRVYIPHPLYELKSFSPVSVIEDEKYFVCFGRIEKYKKLDELIKNWPLDHKLIIAGSSDDKDYCLHLKKLATGKKIEIIDKFISDEDAYNLVSRAEYSILPSDSKSMIVSGSFFFSISAGTPVIAVKSDFYKSLSVYNGELNLVNGIGDIGAALQNLPNKQKIMSTEFTNQFSDDAIINSLKVIIK
ncbi:TPA: glycosyltransferase [Klebsiella variicola]|uniref:glycosyltransferase n=1 Tax=Klebsiella TaxID=570 RepID=UPI00101D6411|nr:MULTISPECIES: glycosyltransferase [Klebsiella]MBB3333314.1 glycosyltransferase involved in cell wall biosynthesis [Klebsiella sp. RC2]MDQ5071692.1 glycosyltransferase [Klebsiella variicola subsp. variicola]HBQ2132642.1 glycosyltransferase [Klebsiella variicola]HBX2038248.1 glycosyltransferase [Klebsiella variicola]HBZ7223041.1 glycosyltransferase [Klebsiella variicola subsp. variicola]